MKVQSLLFILPTFILLHSAVLSQEKILSRKNVIQVAELLIEAGKPRQASSLLSKIVTDNMNDSYNLKAKILSAKILHESGKRIEAIGQLQTLLASPIIHTSQNINLCADAYFALAECYFGMYWMEKFKRVSDTSLQLAIQYHLPSFYKSNACLNIARYYNYQTLEEKAKTFLDTSLLLYQKATQEEKRCYNPILLLSASINYYRNSDLKRLYQIVDSSVILLKYNYPYEKYNQVYLWRAIGNAHFDRARSKNISLNRKWYAPSINAFDKALSILKTFYPENKVDLIYLQNLHGLHDFCCGYYKLADQNFTASKKILIINNMPPADFAYSYLNTYLWQIENMDSLYKGDVLFEKKKKELSEFQVLAPYWEQWEEGNRQAGLEYYRDMYSVNPNNAIVLLCYELYKYQRDKKYLDEAFAAQENSKCYFLKKKMINTYGLSDPHIPTINYVQQQLQPNEALISYSDVESYLHSTYAIVITKDTASMLKIDILNLFDSYHDIKNSDSVCKDINIFKNVYYLAYNILFKPIREFLNEKITRLLVLPSTYSSYINFGMIVSDTAGFVSFKDLPYLNNDYQINYDFSYEVSELRNQFTNKAQIISSNKQAYIPDYSNSAFYQLSFFSRSLQVLKNNFSFTTFSKGSSTVSSYESNAGKAGIIHFAGHCISDDLYAGDLSIVMDSSKTEDKQYLTAEKIIQTPLKTELTVLSLCQTGIGEGHVTGSYLNMAYWFTYAGSKSCLYSNWKLDDRSTAYILERFYHYSCIRMKKSEALRNAKNDYLEQAKTEEEKNPVYWGGLTLIGDDAPVNITEKKKNYYWYFAFLLIVPVIFYWMKRRK